MIPDRWEQLQSLFERALEVCATERAAWLASECANDANLLREVNSLLAFDQPNGLAMTAAVGELAAGWAAAEPVERRIGPYRITGVIAQGGMGVVYSAVRDDDEFRRRVAIKLVRFGAESPEALARFRRERQILATLTHPNIAQLFDGGTTSDGVPYLVMEFVETGRPLTEHCDDRKLGIRQRLEVFRTVCSAVEFAHRHLVVHRDLKPGNILVTESGEVKLLDFGIAKLMEGDDTEARTMTGAHLLTPEYASPEQVRGEAVTTVSDVYSLGAILYELLTREKPHRLKDHSPAEIIRAVCTDEITRPSVVLAAAAGWRKQLQGDLDNIVLRAMNKDQNRRYASVEQLSEDVRRHLAGLPVRARPDTLFYRASKFAGRHSLAIAAAIIVFALVAGAAGMAIYQGRQAQRRFAEVRHLANTFLFTFHDKIANVSGTTEARELVVSTALEYLDRLSRDAGSDRDLRRELAEAYIKVGDVQGSPRGPNLGHFKKAAESYEKARRLTGELLASGGSDTRLLRVSAVAYASMGDLQAQMLKDSKAGAKSLSSATEQGRRLIQQPDASEQDYILYVGHGTRLGDALLDENPAAAAAAYEESLRAARELLKRWPKPESEYRLTTVWAGLGDLRRARGDLLGALAAFQEAQKISEASSRRFPASLRYRMALAVMYERLGTISGGDVHSDFNLGDRPAAEGYMLRAHSLASAIVKADPKNRQMQLNLAIDSWKLASRLPLERWREAIGYTDQCLSITDDLMRAGSAPIHTSIRSNALFVRAGIEAARGKHGPAVRALDELEALNNRELATAPRDLGLREWAVHIRTQRGSALAALRQWERAAAEFDQALKAVEDLGREYPRDLYFLRDRGLAYEDFARFHYARARAGLGDRESLRQAREYAGRSVTIWDEWPRLAPSSPFNQGQRRRVTALLAEIESVLERTGG